MLDDVLLDEDGQVEEPFPLDDPVANADTHLDGRVGNYLLVNGRVHPTGRIRRGVPHRLRLVNTANTTFMRVSIPGHTLHRIGGDGGLLEAPIAVEPIEQVPDAHGMAETISDPDLTKGVLLTPGERADVVFVPTGGRTLTLEWHDMRRGRHVPFLEDGMVKVGHDHHDGKAPPRPLMTFRLFGRGPGEWTPPAELRDIEKIDTSGLTADDKIVLRFGHTPPDPHGFTFQPIEIEFHDDVNGNTVVPFEFLEDKDTIALPSRPGAFGSTRTILRAAVRFDDRGREGQVTGFGKEPTSTTSGGWVVHCHLLEHSASGMMSFFEVLPPEEE